MSAIIIAGMGSPPPVRGTLSINIKIANTCRLTPACAGNTAELIEMAREQEAHPRLCGEHCVSSLALSAKEGSPPPVRGTLDAHIKVRFATRLTPACAGNTRLCK